MKYDHVIALCQEVNSSNCLSRSFARSSRTPGPTVFTGLESSGRFTDLEPTEVTTEGYPNRRRKSRQCFEGIAQPGDFLFLPVHWSTIPKRYSCQATVLVGFADARVVAVRTDFRQPEDEHATIPLADGNGNYVTLDLGGGRYAVSSQSLSSGMTFQVIGRATWPAGHARSAAERFVNPANANARASSANVSGSGTAITVLLNDEGVVEVQIALPASADA